MKKFKVDYVSHFLKLLLGLCAMKLLGVSAIQNQLQQIAKNQSNLYFYRTGASISNTTNTTVNNLQLPNIKNHSQLNFKNHEQNIYNSSHVQKRNVGGYQKMNDSNSKLEIQQRLWDCSFSFNDWCALKLSWIVEKRCVLLKQLKEIFELLKERKNLLSQLGYTTKLVDITTYFVFLNDHISDYNEQLSKIAYTTSVFEEIEPEWASKEVIDKHSDYTSYYY